MDCRWVLLVLTLQKRRKLFLCVLDFLVFRNEFCCDELKETWSSATSIYDGIFYSETFVELINEEKTLLLCGLANNREGKGMLRGELRAQEGFSLQTRSHNFPKPITSSGR